MALQQADETGTIQVVVRVKPVLDADNTIGMRTVVEVDHEENCIRMGGSDPYYNKERVFCLHRVFGPDVRQCDMFDTCVSPLIDDVLLGYNVCVFAYGQTGSGKTYTMEGPTVFAPEPRRSSTAPRRRATITGVEAIPELNATPPRRASTTALMKTFQQDLMDSISKPSPSKQTRGLNENGASLDLEAERGAGLTEEHGFVQRSIYALFDRLELRHRQCHEVSLSHLEIYNEEMHDLMVDDFLLENDRHERRTVFGSALIRCNAGLRLEEDGQGRIRCAGLSECSVTNAADALVLVRRSCQARTTRATFLNERSSRSHSILTLNVSVKNGIDERGMNVERYAQLRLVDLAGSESAKRSGAQGSLVRESTTINQSLLTLGRVIVALVNKLPHIPYRDSKLTRLLQDSLGGSSKTFIVATISALKTNFEETVSTLQYAVNAARITNAPKRNMRTSVNDRIKGLLDENAKLRELLKATQEKNGEIVPQGMLESMERELADLREHVGHLNQRLAIADERNNMLTQTIADMDYQSEAKDRQIQEATDEIEALRVELQTEKQHNIEVKDYRIEQLQLELEAEENMRQEMSDQRVDVLEFELARQQMQNEETTKQATEAFEEECELSVSEQIAKDSKIHGLQSELKVELSKKTELNEIITASNRDKNILTARLDALLERDKRLGDEMRTEYNSLLQEPHCTIVADFLPQEGVSHGCGSTVASMVTRVLRSQMIHHRDEAVRLQNQVVDDECHALQREEALRHEVGAANEKFAEERDMEARTQAELREASELVATSIASLTVKEEEEAALNRKCEHMAMRFEQEASLAEGVRVEMIAKRAAVERESQALEQLVCSAVAEFSRSSNHFPPAFT